LVVSVNGFNVGNINRIPTSCSTLTGSSCVFPFTYKGVTYSQCTYADSPVPWCATATSSDGSVITNSWGDCDISSHTSSCSTQTISTSSCVATSGATCIFPFRYKGVVYSECTSVDQTQPWCSTSVTAAGEHIDGSLGFCPSTCPGASGSSGGSGGSGGCTPGSVFNIDCNTCVCSSAGEPVCSNNICSTTTTTTTTAAPSSGCVTTGGPAAGQACVFPFTWAGVTHSSCAEWIYGGQAAGTTWCSTKVDSASNHVNGEGNYGFCPSTCPAPDVAPQSLRFRSAAGAISFGGNNNQKPN